MVTTQPGRILEDQHRRIDEGVKGIIDGSGPTVALARSLALLRLHLYVEEEILFPPLEASGLAMPVLVMKREHGQMWPLIQDLSAACDAGDGADALRDRCDTLFRLLRIHNPKEEQIVYTAADRLAAKPDGRLRAADLEVAEPPEGWRCAMAPH